MLGFVNVKYYGLVSMLNNNKHLSFLFWIGGLGGLNVEKMLNLEHFVADFLNPDDSEVSPTGTLETEEKHNELNFPGENPYEHS